MRGKRRSRLRRALAFPSTTSTTSITAVLKGRPVGGAPHHAHGEALDPGRARFPGAEHGPRPSTRGDAPAWPTSPGRWQEGARRPGRRRPAYDAAPIRRPDARGPVVAALTHLAE